MCLLTTGHTIQDYDEFDSVLHWGLIAPLHCGLLSRAANIGVNTNLYFPNIRSFEKIWPRFSNRQRRVVCQQNGEAELGLYFTGEGETLHCEHAARFLFQAEGGIASLRKFKTNEHTFYI